MTERNNLIPVQPAAGDLIAAGHAADIAAAKLVFARYQELRPENTLIKQAGDLRLFARYLAAMHVRTGDFFRDVEAWRGVTAGIVYGFVEWMYHEGYAMGTISSRQATVKRYCQLAHAAGVLDSETYERIRAIRTMSMAEAEKRDQKRDTTRKGCKKAQPNRLKADQVERLKTAPRTHTPKRCADAAPAAATASEQRSTETPQRRRDALLIALLVDLGLRVSEIANLPPDAIDLETGILRFYRQKVRKWQNHQLRDDTLVAARRYLTIDGAGAVYLLRASRKSGKLLPRYDEQGAPIKMRMSARAIQGRIQAIGCELFGIKNLSPHDLRHTWTDRVRRGKTDFITLMEAGGWSNYATPLRYLDQAKIANDGVRLG